MISCFKCGEAAPAGEVPRGWWPVMVPDRTEWLCSGECVYLSYPWKLSGKRAIPRPVKLKDHISNAETFSSALTQMMERE